MGLEPVVILPPYWFAPGMLESTPILDRIEKLAKMRKQIDLEIARLRSVISQPEKTANAGN